MSMVALLTAIPEFINIAPSLVQLLVRIMSLSGKIVAIVEKNDLHNLLEKVESKIDELSKAKTVSEKLSAARGISDILRSLQ